MKALDLFSGIGGISLAAEWAGIETVAFCEIESFCQKVLQKHWPDVPIFDDVRKLSRQALEERGVDVGSIELVFGGYPCQPFSVAGKRQGERDDRHLWPEVYRLLKEIRPTWFLGENVAGHVTLGLDQVLSDLEDIGYSSQAFIIPACSVNAPTEETGYLLLPTPVASDATTGAIIGKEDTFRLTSNGTLRKVNRKGTNGSIGLGRLVKLWPTPTTGAGLCGGTGNFQQLTRLMKQGVISDYERRQMSQGNGGQLNPEWVEWLMGYPTGWTDLNHSETL